MPESPSRDDRPVGAAPPAYRLPDSLRLGRVRLQVADLTRSLAFYEKVLGLSGLDRQNGRAVLGVGEDAAALVELAERPGARPRSRRGRLGLYHVAFLLPDRRDLGAFVQHLGERGIRAGMSDHEVSEAVYLNDPDGLGIEVYADRPRDKWRHDADGQVAMTTKPLDVQNLTQAADETMWTGMPSGTVLGHVHLHVGDLDEAAAFYHAALGFDKVVWNYPGALFLSAGGYHHHLGTNTWAAGAPSAADEDARLLEWTLLLPEGDVEAAGRSLEAAGYSVTRDGDAYLTADPWGTSLRLATSD